MKTLYIYLIDTLADWEISLLLAEVNSKRFFKKDSPMIDVKFVAPTLSPITTMGGLSITPNCILDSIQRDNSTLIVLPGAETWNDVKHQAILNISKQVLQNGGVVAAICGATAALANTGILDDRPHTSNGPGFLEMVSPVYKGSSFYQDKPSVSDNNLITGNSTASLEWTRDVLEILNVYHEDSLSAWYDYFNSGSMDAYFALMNTLKQS
jgi:putative intracellular protease/amidase